MNEQVYRVEITRVTTVTEHQIVGAKSYDEAVHRAEIGMGLTVFMNERGETFVNPILLTKESNDDSAD